MTTLKITLASSLLLLAGAFAAADSFVTPHGTTLLGRDGNPITLRGTNCGNWMVTEPYMMNTSGNLDRQYKLFNMIADVLGNDRADEFERMWMDNVFSEADMKFLAEQGFNCLRVPMHYKYFTLPIEQEPVNGQQTWLPEGFARIDKMVEWAERYGILLILDMHACPGGQSSGDICDYDSSKPSLWTSTANQDKLVALWRHIAERYAQTKCIVGYDMINETNWSLSGNKALWELYRRIIAAIREVDANHIVIVEGNSYGNDYNGFPSSNLDSKMMLQYHRYDVYNTENQISAAYYNGLTHKCPVFIGEFGENSNAWNTEAVRLMEECGQFAGWTVWPMKKNGSSCLLQVKTPSSYTSAINKWINGSRPTADELWAGLKAWAEAQAFSRCSVSTDYIDALLRQPYDDTPRPFVDNRTVTSRIYAVQYDLGSEGVAYHDSTLSSYKYSGESATTWQNGWSYRNDGVDIGTSNTSQAVNYYVGWTTDGEWLQYTIDNTTDAARYKMEFSYAVASGSATIHMTCNGRLILAPTELSSTGGALSWRTKAFSDIVLPKGTLHIRIHIDKGGINLNYFKFYSKQDATADELAELASTDDNLLVGGDCTQNDGWMTAALGSVNTLSLTWNSTSYAPTDGDGHALNIKSAKSSDSNIAIYQPVEVIEGHTYKADFAFRGARTNSQFWVQAFVSTTAPVGYADRGLSEEATIGQLNHWTDSSLATYDGMASAKAVAGSAHRDGVMTWVAPSSDRYYFIIKTGSLKTSYNISLDDITFVDVTAPDYDINADGKVNIADAQRLLNIMSGTYVPAAGEHAGDVNADGIVNVADVQRILNVMTE